MISRPRVVLTLLAALIILALPASASAAVFTVDSTGDEADKTLDGSCETNTVGECTLRAAIQESNASAAIKDTILFDLSVFDGQLADTIAPATKLPALSSPAEINAGTCLTAAGINGPCAGVNGPSGEVGFEVTADETSISGLSITGVSLGIGVFVGSTDFAARGNWVGVKLDGSAGANSNVGIFIGPESDGASIGGTEVVQRNVIANTAGVGLDLEGASEATIAGNYLGVGPNGTTQMSNGTNIEITGRTGLGPSEHVEAEDNVVGAVLGESATNTTACDGGCNVISGALGDGIDLNGSFLQSEKAAAGPTVVHGNFVGLNAAGTTAVPNAGVGLFAGTADHVRVGGPSSSALDPERNYIAGGSEGIVNSSGAEDFEVRGNSIGFAADGTEVAPPGAYGIFTLSLGVSEESSIENNNVRMVGGVGIEVRFLTGRIIGNRVVGGARGIVVGFGEGGGLIAGNEVDEQTQAGILVESGKNDIRGNTVTNSHGPGIAVKPPPGVTATIGNVIGGSTTDTENVIDGSDGPAIEIVEEAGEPGSWTEVTRNRGAFNGGLFIDLVAGANEGIVPASFSAAIQSKAEGTALPEARIRVFRKASAEAGELQSFLAETESDSDGNWKVTYPSIPAGTIVAVTQTNANGATSELVTTTVGADPQPTCADTPAMCLKPETPGLPAPQPVPAADTTAPKVTIKKAPKAKSSNTTAKFKFVSDEAGSKFQCKLDKGKFKGCRSPKTYKKLKPGKHVFTVRAIDKAGNVGKPAKRKFTVLG